MKQTILYLSLIALCATGCIRKYGCTSSNAFNYDPDANEDSGLCEFAADAFGGYYDGSESIYHIALTGDTVLTKNDSFIIFIADTNRIQLKGFYECANAQDTIGCIVAKYDAFLSGTSPCTNGWQDFKLTREGDSVVTYSYKEIYTPNERDSIVGRARKRP